jgi:hypothetical protein
LKNDRAFLIDPGNAVVDRIIDHLKLTFTAEKPPLAWAFQDLDMVADPPVEYFP